MKLIEVKNSLAKLYYKPTEFSVTLSDFLTIDDGNQKLLSQVVSIESTTQENTNCAILKFSMDLSTDNKATTYSGYVPSCDAIVTKTQPKIINEIFSENNDFIEIGTLTNTSNIPLNLNGKILDNFLYIQSDNIDNSDNIENKILKYCEEKNKKLLVIDTNGTKDYSDEKVIELGKDFKLPINNEILNYIYENDLTGLTVEQKAIVQDIILEIQEYIETLENKFIPFDTLLDVVNSVYETDKSVGVILFRNKLIKYNQLGIFASKEKEFLGLTDIVESNSITILKISNTKENWQKECINFIINNLKTSIYIYLEANDSITDKNIINRLYKQENFRPIIISKYDEEIASYIKTFAKNLILFKPNEQQRSFATYNSFLMKLADNEFIVSGKETFYTPLILKPEYIINEVEEQPEELQSETIKDDENIITEAEVEVFDENNEITEKPQAELISEENDFSDLPALEELEEEPNELKEIFEESLEQEIAKDVDKMFFVDTTTTDTPADESEFKSDEIIEDIPYEDMFSDDDLDLLDGINAEETTYNEEETVIRSSETEKEELVEDIESLPEEENDLEAISDIQLNISAQEQQLEDFSDLESLEDAEEESNSYSSNNIVHETENTNEEKEILELPELEDSTLEETENETSVLENLTENESLPSIPIYKTEIDSTSNDVKFAEGNIVYHEKYGRGVVEQLITYGNKTLCSIQFDNVGRRLLDPSLADLKQI